HDDVTVSDGTNAGVGTVKFFLCTPAQVTAGGCEGSAGTQVGVVKTLNGSGQASSDSVTGLTTPNDNAPGTDCWRAEFTPGANDPHNHANAHTNCTNESVVVIATPTITTTVSELAGAPGDSISDSATLHGTSNLDGTGSVTFYLFAPGTTCST